MWLTAPNRIGIAAWQSEDALWSIKTVGAGQDGLELFRRENPIRLVASDSLGDSNGTLPALAEQFVRSNQLHLSFPQTDELQFGYQLVVRPVDLLNLKTGPNRSLFELQVSVQTTLLDSHPTLDMLIPSADDMGSRASENLTTSVLSVAGVDRAVQTVTGNQFAAALLLSPQDAPFTTCVHVDDPPATQGIQARLFGGFLEKGVIRRARPWLMIDRSGQDFDRDLLKSAWYALAESPLPLA